MNLLTCLDKIEDSLMVQIKMEEDLIKMKENNNKFHMISSLKEEMMKRNRKLIIQKKEQMMQQKQLDLKKVKN